MLGSGIKNFFCVLLAFTALFCCGCESTEQSETQVYRETDTAQASGPPAENEPAADEKRPLRIAFSGRSDTYSPFYPENELERLVSELTGVKLLARDRNGEAILSGIGGESRFYNGNYYFYSGISDVSEHCNEETGETVFSIKLREDVLFSDGELLDADDVIFTLYMLLDPSVSASPLRKAGIKGERSYRLDCAADSLTDEEIAEAMQTGEAKRLIRDKVIEPALRELYEWAKALYNSDIDGGNYAAYMKKCPEPKDLLAFFYSVDSGYDPAGKEAEQVISELADMYGGDFELLGKMNSGNADEYRDEAEAAVISYLAGEKGETAPCDHISGIAKTGDFSLDITVKGSSSGLLRLLTDVTVAPLHYYGDESLYDFDAHKFGFEKNSAAEIMREKAGKPLGAGAYRLLKSENGRVSLSANEFYYKGAPLTENIEIVPTDTENMIEAVMSGSADISFPNACAQTSEDVKDESLAEFPVALDGCGFIGINANTVNIGGEPFSEESCLLRKALAAAIYLYRESSVSEYYGKSGITADYPAAVLPYLKGTELDGYLPYCTDTDGEPIYGGETDEESRYGAAKSACLKFFEAAGYTVENDRIIEAPGGGSTEFHALIAAGGTGSHPSYGALSGAKKLLGEIGITLETSDATDISQLWARISGGVQQIWAYVRETGTESELGEMYPSDDIRGYIGKIKSADKNVLSEAYAGFYGLIYDKYVLEIPVYQRSACVLASASRVDARTFPENMTCYYGWADEIEKIVLK